MRIADHADYRITLNRAGDAPTEKLLVTFGGQPSDLSDEGFGTLLARQYGWDNIYVAQRHGTQYQGLSVDAFSSAIAEHAQGRDVICYGSSLGAYAALYYGGCLDARIIAAAPMLPAWRPLRQWQYADLPMTHHEVVEGPISRHSPVVILDPLLPNDLKTVREMVQPAYPDARIVELPYAGHTVLLTLSKARLLKPFILGIINDDEIIPLNMPTVTCPIWNMHRGKHLTRTDPDKARRHLERSIELEPSLHASSLLLVMLIRNGNLADAQSLIDQSAASGDRRRRFNKSALEQARGAGLSVAV